MWEIMIPSTSPRLVNLDSFGVSIFIKKKKLIVMERRDASPLRYFTPKILLRVVENCIGDRGKTVTDRHRERGGKRFEGSLVVSDAILFLRKITHTVSSCHRSIFSPFDQNRKCDNPLRLRSNN